MGKKKDKVDKYVTVRARDLKKELFEEIMNFKIDYFKVGKDTIFYTHSGLVMPTTNNINIYEFAFMCKEWAFKKGYTIVDGIDDLGESICYIMKITGYSLCNYYEQGINYKNVFTACEWILIEETKLIKDEGK